jgi:DNA-binding CsgD family transcriptional regulator
VNYVAAGLTNPAIARKMGISRNTVRNQLGHALQKLNLKNRYEVAAAVIRSKSSI